MKARSSRRVVPEHMQRGSRKTLASSRAKAGERGLLRSRRRMPSTNSELQLSLLVFPRRRQAGSPRRLAGQFEWAIRAERNFVELDSLRQQPERILDRLREQRPDRNGAGLAGALDAERIERRCG